MSGYISSFVEKYHRENNLDYRCLLIVKNCAVPPLGMDKNGGDVEEILALLVQDLTEEEWMQLYMESIQTEIKDNSEQPENEGGRKRSTVCNFAGLDSGARIAG